MMMMKFYIKGKLKYPVVEYFNIIRKEKWHWCLHGSIEHDLEKAQTRIGMFKSKPALQLEVNYVYALPFEFYQTSQMFSLGLIVNKKLLFSSSLFKEGQQNAVSVYFVSMFIASYKMTAQPIKSISMKVICSKSYKIFCSNVIVSLSFLTL